MSSLGLRWFVASFYVQGLTRPRVLHSELQVRSAWCCLCNFLEQRYTSRRAFASIFLQTLMTPLTHT